MPLLCSAGISGLGARMFLVPSSCRPACAPAGNRVSQGSPNPKGVLMSLASRGAEFFRFCIVGGLTFLVDYGLLFLLTSVLDVHYLWSSAWAFIVAVIVNYYLCVFFVFHQAARSFARQVVFVGSSLAGLGINQICMWLLVDKLALHYMLAKVVATGVVMIWNYIMKRKALS